MTASLSLLGIGPMSGGPWQRDSERSEKLSSEAAMQIAKRSYLEDLLRGFDLLHIDPTKDPHTEGSNSLQTVIERTVDLIEYVEKERRKRGLPETSYEVGTEETSGGLTSPEVYDSFIKRLNAILLRKGLPLPAFIVGQTGTLVRMRITRICGHYVFDDPEVRDALERLTRNLAALGIDAEGYVDDRIDKSIDRYVTCFNLQNLTSKLLAHSQMS
jgi:hypothetical protein